VKKAKKAARQRRTIKKVRSQERSLQDRDDPRTAEERLLVERMVAPLRNHH
jgi:hypothetical protein